MGAVRFTAFCPLRERTDDILPLARHFLSSSFALFEALSDGGWRGIARKVSASKTTKLEYV